LLREAKMRHGERRWETGGTRKREIVEAAANCSSPVFRLLIAPLPASVLSVIFPRQFRHAPFRALFSHSHLIFAAD
jgi:hypothetical protein